VLQANAAAAAGTAAAVQVTVIEALLTLLMFVLLLVIGWAVDVKVWTRFFKKGRVMHGGHSDAVVVSRAREQLGPFATVFIRV
jgi:hypothetical protein